VILEAVHFLVEIGNLRHARLNGIDVIRSYGCHAAEALWIESLKRRVRLQRHGGFIGNSSRNLGLIRRVFFSERQNWSRQDALDC
jgi:hypothetical protein